MAISIEEEGKSNINDANDNEEGIELVILRGKEVELGTKAKQLDNKLKGEAQSEKDVAVFKVSREVSVRRGILIT